jgi:hypothetical protein
MPPPDGDRLASALQGLTIGVINDLKDFEKLREKDGLREVDQQFWLEFSGQAQEFAQWQEAWVMFDQFFVDATGNRDSPFDRPHFTYGSVIDSPTPVGVLATVMEYKVNQRGETVGAKVAIGILSTDQPVRVRGRVNLTFQGYGQAPTNVPDDMEA